MDASHVETVLKMAALARLDIGADEAQTLARDFASTLEHFRVLSELDLGPSGTALARSCASTRLRPDEPRPPLSADEALLNAPERVEDFYRVPKTVGGAE